MIRSHTCYTVRCDNCINEMQGFEEAYTEHFPSREAAQKAVREREWDHEGMDTHFCEECVLRLWRAIARCIRFPQPRDCVCPSPGCRAWLHGPFTMADTTNVSDPQ